VATYVTAPPDVITQTPVVDEVNVTAFPDPPPVAVAVQGIPKVFVPGFANVIAWVPIGVTEFEAPEAVPVPSAFVAVTAHVYAVPLVNPVTTIGLVEPFAVTAPHVAV